MDLNYSTPANGSTKTAIQNKPDSVADLSVLNDKKISKNKQNKKQNYEYNAPTSPGEKTIFIYPDIHCRVICNECHRHAIVERSTPESNRSLTDGLLAGYGNLCA